MTTTYNYTFDNLTRIGDDNCGITARDAQNSAMGSYNTTNYFLSYCGMKKPIEFATQQPAIMYNGGFGNSGAGGCNIASDSKLRIGSIQTHPKCRISLQQRPFKTVPFLGKGKSNPLQESKLQQGTYFADKKSCPVAIIVGETEIKENKFTIKNLKSSKDNDQKTVSKESLIDEIKKIL